MLALWLNRVLPARCKGTLGPCHEARSPPAHAGPHTTGFVPLLDALKARVAFVTARPEFIERLTYKTLRSRYSIPTAVVLSGQVGVPSLGGALQTRRPPGQHVFPACSGRNEVTGSVLCHLWLPWWHDTHGSPSSVFCVPLATRLGTDSVCSRLLKSGDCQAKTGKNRRVQAGEGILDTVRGGLPPRLAFGAGTLVNAHARVA